MALVTTGTNQSHRPRRRGGAWAWPRAARAKSSTSSATTAPAATTAPGAAPAQDDAQARLLWGPDRSRTPSSGINIKDGETAGPQPVQRHQPRPSRSPSTPSTARADPSQANNGATKLINDKVVAVIGPAFSGESAAADPIFESAGIPNVSASATNVKLAQNGWKFFHRVLADDGAQGPGDADYLVKTLGAKTVYGHRRLQHLRRGPGQRGALHPEDQRWHRRRCDDHIAPTGADYGSTVNKVVAAKPSAVFFGGYYDAAGRLVNQLRGRRLQGCVHVR